MINCSGCGKFFDMAKPHAWKMVYGGAPIPSPDGEIYRCERCLEKLGPFEPQHGIRPEYSCGVSNLSATGGAK